MLLKILYNTKFRININGNSKFLSKLFSLGLLQKMGLAAKNGDIRQRCIFEITKENIRCCKDLMKTSEIRHMDENEANFIVNDTDYMGFVAMNNELLQATYSNKRKIIEQQEAIFETLWNKAVPAERKIRQIEESLQSEFLEVISDRKKAMETYIDLAKGVDKEALLLFANVKAIIRADRLGVLDYLIDASKRGALIRIITPINNENCEIVKQLSEKTPHIKILNGGSSHSGLFIVDSIKLLRFELRDPKAEEFSEAIGFVSYSNSKVAVYSSKSFFELLWNEHVQYERLKESDKMKDEFINVAAHELRTPIQPILSLTEVLRSKVKEPQQQELLDVIIRNAKRSQQLTNDILDVTKIESHSLNLKKEPFNLNDIITNVIDDIMTNRDPLKWNQKNDNDIMKISYQPQHIFVEADKARITQVISNLLSNAVKFTEEKGGNIHISTENIDSQVLVSVKDSGNGIDPEILPKLFSKFTSKSYQGTGLGLFISKSIVEAHGGKIWAINNIHDKGATFTFTLPISRRYYYHHHKWDRIL
jgi:two-component system, OmpR family, sensor histidine kinase VicK